MTKYYSQELAEMMAVNALLCYTEKYSERTISGEVIPEEKCGYRASLIEDMLWVFYKDKRGSIGIRIPNSDMTNQELVEFVLDEALSQIAEDNPLFLKREWNGNYSLVTEDIF